MATCLVGCSGSAGGDPLPAIENIRSFSASYFDRASGGFLKFDVPRGHWKPILSALQPARSDPDPAKWLVLGELRITLNDGRPFRVDLYSVSEGDGAFSAGPTFEERTYYRGGKTSKLIGALEAARKDSVRDAL